CWLISMRVLLLSTPHPLEESPVPPLSLSYLASVLDQEGIEVKILDFLVTQYHPKKLRRELEDYRPQLVGATCVTLNYPIARRMLKACKAFDPYIFTVIGGPHVTFALEETLLQSPWIDAVVIGEGERTLVELVRAVEEDKDIHQVPGIAFADGGMVVKTPPQARIENLDQLPLPARELLPMARYRALGTPCTVITSRGCPFSCIFCSGRRMFGPKVRFRSPGLVVDEIEKLQCDFGLVKINIVDDTFTLNHHHTRAVCEEMLRRNLKMKWSAFARVDRISEDLAQLMNRAGCEWVLFGVESADEGILKTIRKGITLDGVQRGVKIAAAAGINVFNSFILGLPGESWDTALKSMAFGDELYHKYGAKYGFHMLSPLPGTEVYERAKDYGIRILSRNWARYNANEPITETATMSTEMIKEAMAIYNRGIEVAWDDIKRRAKGGDAQCAEIIEGKEREEFVWTLLQRDVIEGLGVVAPATVLNPSNAEAELARRVSRKLGLDIEVAQRRMSELIAKGVLRLEPKGNSLRWQWSDTQKLKLTSEITPATSCQA
ncbi:MAG TPA: radical SAM protein, partial [Dehalococcoidia bacterium]|nr:radical SAM protein [Dehalococcoidia bacterium]